MKVQERQVKIDSNTTGEVIPLHIDAANMNIIIGHLTDLYEDPKMAVLREYSTNAWDAHVEAGVTRPIEVTLPTTLNPYLRIKDYGVGLDVDQVRKVYASYGASTKRDTNDLQGALGLGCKSALTYTDQFNVSAVKNGVKIEVMVSRSENGGGEMEVVDEYETDEPNGVEISVQTGKWDTFENEAERLFKFWDEGTVLVNGEQPERIDGFWISEDLLIIEEQNRDAIVMGNVAYPLPDEYNDYSRHYSIIAFVPIGSVSFTPAREALMMNPETKKTVDSVMERVETEASKAITKQVAEAKTKPEAVALYTKLSAIFRGRFEVAATYRGAEIPADMEAPKDQKFLSVDSTSKKGYRSKGWSRTDHFPSTLWHKTIFIRGYDGGDFSPYKRAKMDQWLAEKGIEEPDIFIFTKVVPHHHWIAKNRIFPWQEIKDQKIVREQVQTRNGRVSGSYEGYVDGARQYEILAQDIDTSNPIIYSVKSHGYGLSAFSGQLPEKYTFVQIGENRINKFCRDFPNAQTINEYLTGLAQKWVDNLTEEQKLSLHINGEIDHYEASKIKGLETDDPELTFAVQQVSARDSKLRESYNAFKHLVSLDVDWENPLDRYPLLQEMRFYGTLSGKQKEHVTLYINAAYAASQEETS